MNNKIEEIVDALSKINCQPEPRVIWKKVPVEKLSLLCWSVDMYGGIVLIVNWCKKARSLWEELFPGQEVPGAYGS